jgi:hypothetical protein
MSNASDAVSKRLKALQAEREEQGSLRPTGEEIFYRRVERFLSRSRGDVALDGEELLEELKVAYFSWGGRDVPTEMRVAIEAKIQQARAANAELRSTNKGGRPPKYEKMDLWWAAFRAFYVGDIKTQRDMRSHLRGWAGENWYDQPAANYLNDMIKEIIVKFRDDPDIRLPH